MLGKRKPNFVIGLIIIKVNIERLEKGNRKVPQKLFHTHFCLNGPNSFEDLDFLIFEQCKTHVQLKEKETFR